METKEKEQLNPEKENVKAEETTQKEEKELKKPDIISFSALKMALERVDESKIQNPLSIKTLMLSRTSQFWTNLERMLNVGELFKGKRTNPVTIVWAQADKDAKPELAFLAPNTQALLMAIYEEMASFAIFNRSAGRLEWDVTMPALGIESSIRGLSILLVLLTIIIGDEQLKRQKQQEENKSK